MTPEEQKGAISIIYSRAKQRRDPNTAPPVLVQVPKSGPSPPPAKQKRKGSVLSESEVAANVVAGYPKHKKHKLVPPLAPYLVLQMIESNQDSFDVFHDAPPILMHRRAVRARRCALMLVPT